MQFDLSRINFDWRVIGLSVVIVVALGYTACGLFSSHERQEPQGVWWWEDDGTPEGNFFLVNESLATGMQILGPNSGKPATPAVYCPDGKTLAKLDPKAGFIMCNGEKVAYHQVGTGSQGDDRGPRE